MYVDKTPTHVVKPCKANDTVTLNNNLNPIARALPTFINLMIIWVKPRVLLVIKQSQTISNWGIV